MGKYQREITDAIKDPEYFYCNFLLNESSNNNIEIICIDDAKYICVYFWLYQVVKDNDQALTLYRTNHNRPLSIEYPLFHGNSDANYISIIKKCPDIRDSVYDDEYDILLSCKNISDYLSFLNSKPLCREFELFAKFRLSELNDSRFIEYQEVIRDYSHSNIFRECHIDKITAHCEFINEIAIMWNASTNEAQKEVLRGILTSMSHKNDIYISHNYLKKTDYLKIIYDNKSHYMEHIINRSNEYAVLSLADIELLSFKIEEITGYKLALPTLESINELGLRNSESPIEWCSDNDNNIMLIKNDTIYSIEKMKNKVYANIRLTILDK